MAVTSGLGRIIHMTAPGDVVPLCLSLNSIQWLITNAVAGDACILIDPITDEVLFHDVATGDNFHVESMALQNQPLPNGIEVSVLAGGEVRLFYK